MRRLLLVGIAAALAALAACAPPEPAHDIAYYRDHANVRAAKIQACQNERGKLAATSNCINALAADSAAHAAHFYDATTHNASGAAPRVADPGKL